MTDTQPQSDRAAGTVVIDAELDTYRNLLDEPDSFASGFGWITVVGAVFCGLCMFPGAIYLGLLSGLGMGSAAQWVTVIIFSEITRRALKAMSRQEMVVLLTVAGAMIGGSALMPGGPFGNLIWRGFLVDSDAVKDAGLYGLFPSWWAPPPDSTALSQRTFFHSDWALPVMFLVFMMVTSFIEKFTLGYALFRLTSDVEKLPFPMAPIAAQGSMALVEGQSGEKSWRWTAFSIGAVMGLAFGVVQVGVPAVSSAFLEKPITPIPLPWFELTPVTDGVLPATATGIMIDLGLILVGFVIPFWAVVGAALSVLLTFVLNPILYHSGILTTWQPGMDSVNTIVSNNVDFYFSLGIGMALGLAVVSIVQTVRQVRRSLRERREARDGDAAPSARESIWSPRPGRGDWSLRLCVVGYTLSAGATVGLCKWLVPQFSVFFLVLFAFVYTPLTSYLNARISGIAGQHIDIPFVREAFILLSGVKGVHAWLLPLPIENYGGVSQEMRTFELTGTRLTSQVKAWLLTTPLVFVLSLVFWSFLWQDGPIPSDMYPYAQKMWDLQAKNTMIMWTATSGEAGQITLFDRSWHPSYVGVGAVFTIVVFAGLSMFGAPTMLVYGLVRGLGQIPHGLILELFGALLARLYFHRKFGKKPFLQAAPVILAGYFTGAGLIAMAAVAIRLIVAGISQSPI
ncbi:MAG: peptide transporter [Phycisphaeraceae bacterium]|nr:peptide transporter [Phycisphaeraceae bacterium]